MAKSASSFRLEDQTDVQLLVDLGLKKVAAKTFLLMAKLPTASSEAIQKGTGLSQPEISVAIQFMKKHGWVKEIRENRPGRGRPIHIYSLKVPLQDISAWLENQELSGQIPRCAHHGRPSGDEAIWPRQGFRTISSRSSESTAQFF